MYILDISNKKSIKVLEKKISDRLGYFLCIVTKFDVLILIVTP